MSDTSFWSYFISDDFVAGSIAGSIGIVLTQPLDTIRIRCQLDKSMGIRQHFMTIAKQEGIRGLFRGVASPTLTVGLMSAVLFQSFESSKSLISSFKRHYYQLDELPNPSYTDLAISGGIAGTISCLITSPTELFKILVQENTSADSATMKQEFKEGLRLWQKHGFTRGVYRGLNVTIYRDAPAFAIYFPLYEVIINNWDPYRATQIVPFIGGGLAGMLSWAAVYPMDHVKTLYQLRKYEYVSQPLHRAILSHLRREGGIHTIYKGLGATLLRCTPQHAVVFVCYEEVKKFLAQTAKESEQEDLITITIPPIVTSSNEPIAHSRSRMDFASSSTL
eukprot:CAMPEP_0197027760 /NCGR_PEP_ID=MMETSP1384-20130603/7648_1 /TAXON_ID=29189 /ORGANISM="Ammonia sp." /LENGTH=334 /DNA_ID=CAMNT_0042456661 /DNA_START=38 /DNA_END=1042 /DNA_ORIENTATION=+